MYLVPNPSSLKLSFTGVVEGISSHSSNQSLVAKNWKAEILRISEKNEDALMGKITAQSGIIRKSCWELIMPQRLFSEADRAILKMKFAQTAPEEPCDAASIAYIAATSASLLGNCFGIFILMRSLSSPSSDVCKGICSSE